MADPYAGRGARGLTQEHSFEYHRSGGSVEPAQPTDLARQVEDTEDMTPIGPRRDLRRGLALGVICGLAFGLLLAAVGLLPWGIGGTWERAGVLGGVGLLGGLVYGTVLGAAARARSDSPPQPTGGSRRL